MRRLLLVLVLSASLVAVAGAVWQDDFEDGVAGPLSWQTFAYPFGAGVTLDETALTPGTLGEGNRLLQLYGNLDAGAGGAQIVLGYIAETMSDVTISGLVAGDPAHGQDADVGLVGRMTLPGGVPSGYVLTIDFVSGALDISRVDSLVVTGIGTSGAIGSFLTTEDYYLEFEFNGSSLTGRAYDEIGGSLLASVAATDATYASGYFGVGANANGSSLFSAGIYDNIVVPEPATMTMLAMGAASMFLRRKRR